MLTLWLQPVGPDNLWLVFVFGIPIWILSALAGMKTMHRKWDKYRAL
jgi:hypothetical protein